MIWNSPRSNVYLKVWGFSARTLLSIMMIPSKLFSNHFLFSFSSDLKAEFRYKTNFQMKTIKKSCQTFQFESVKTKFSDLNRTSFLPEIKLSNLSGFCKTFYLDKLAFIISDKMFCQNIPSWPYNKAVEISTN